MLYAVYGYSNTGFSPLNVPDSQTLLTSMQQTQFDGIWLLQDLAQASVRVKGTWSVVRQIDYVRIDNTFYFCTGVRMLNENTAELSLELDALTTIGINNLVINSGWCKRRHVDSDGLFENVIDEDWGPTEPYVMDTTAIGPSDKTERVYICSTVDLNLSTAERVADTYTDGASSGSVTVPRAPEAAVASEILLDFSSQGTQESSLIKKLPLTTLYKGTWDDGTQNTFIQESIAILRSLGLENAITGSYAIPAGYIDAEINASTPNYQVYHLTSYPHQVAGPAFRWSGGDYTVRNNKVFAGQFNKFLLISPVTGDSVTLDAHDIYIDDTTNSNFTYFADLGPGGAPYCRPTQYRGQQPTNEGPWYEQCVTGGKWLDTPIAYSSASGGLITSTQAAQQAVLQYGGLQRTRESAELGYMLNTMNIASSAATQGLKGAGTALAVAGAGGIPAAALSVGSAGLNMFKQLYAAGQFYDLTKRGLAYDELNINMQQYNTLASTSLVAPEIKFPRTDTIQSFTGNNFQVIRYRLSQNDTERFDRYLTMFGYAVSEPLYIGAFSGRQYFNFVQAQSIDITVPSGVPLRVKMRAIEQLSQGVRIWHVKPSNVYFANNPIVS